MNGFFSQEAMEVLQQAYELQLTPEEIDIDPVSGLPSNTVSNTSPWHGKVEMWTYPDGKNKMSHPEIHYIPQEEDEVEEEEVEEESIDAEYETEEEDIEESMTEEEVDALIEELLDSDEDEE